MRKMMRRYCGDEYESIPRGIRRIIDITTTRFCWCCFFVFRVLLCCTSHDATIAWYVLSMLSALHLSLYLLIDGSTCDKRKRSEGGGGGSFFSFVLLLVQSSNLAPSIVICMVYTSNEQLAYAISTAQNQQDSKKRQLLIKQNSPPKVCFVGCIQWFTCYQIATTTIQNVIHHMSSSQWGVYNNKKQNSSLDLFILFLLFPCCYWFAALSVQTHLEHRKDIPLLPPQQATPHHKLAMCLLPNETNPFWRMRPSLPNTNPPNFHQVLATSLLRDLHDLTRIGIVPPISQHADSSPIFGLKRGWWRANISTNFSLSDAHIDLWSLFYRYTGVLSPQKWWLRGRSKVLIPQFATTTTHQSIFLLSYIPHTRNTARPLWTNPWTTTQRLIAFCFLRDCTIIIFTSF